MKNDNRQKRILTEILCAVSFIIASVSCTDNFENINTNPFGVDPNEANAVGIANRLQKPQENLFPESVGMLQWWNNLHVDIYAGYFMGVGNFGGDNNYYYGFREDNHGPFENFYLNVMKYTREYTPACKLVNKNHLGAISQICQVLGMLTVVDTYGPSPYRSVKEIKNTLYYDSDKQIYYDLFDDITEAIGWLKEFVASNPSEEALAEFKKADKLCGGDPEKWIRFANTIRLRMAMRIVKADPVNAQAYAELSVREGVLTIADSDIELLGGWAMRALDFDYNDSRANANIICILKGYSDPRLDKWFLKNHKALSDINGVEVLPENQEFVGIRQGVPITEKTQYMGYSHANCNWGDSRLIMRPAEALFLRAEGALRGWNMGGTPQELYEEGIRSAFKSVSITDPTIVDSYIKGELYDAPDFDWDLMEGGFGSAEFVNYYDEQYNIPAGYNDVSVKWHEEDGREKKLQRIITQKWLALYPYSFEAWSEFRRTGYPKLFAIPAEMNQSSGTIDTDIQIRRMKFTEKEYNTNSEEVMKARALLNQNGAFSPQDGYDIGGTRIWWDIDTREKTEPNF